MVHCYEANPHKTCAQRVSGQQVTHPGTSTMKERKSPTEFHDWHATTLSCPQISMWRWSEPVHHYSQSGKWVLAQPCSPWSCKQVGWGNWQIMNVPFLAFNLTWLYDKIVQPKMHSSLPAPTSSWLFWEFLWSPWRTQSYSNTWIEAKVYSTVTTNTN